MEATGFPPTNKKRPILVIVVSILLIAAGALGIVYHGREFVAAPNLENVLVLIVRALAIVAGIFMLRGSNWARWLAMLWIAFHVALSAFHPIGELAMHIVILSFFAFALFRADAREYFRRGDVKTS